MITAIAILLIILVAGIIGTSMKIIPQSTTMVIERLGKYHKTLKSGINIVVPFIDQPKTIEWSDVRNTFFPFLSWYTRLSPTWATTALSGVISSATIVVPMPLYSSLCPSLTTAEFALVTAVFIVSTGSASSETEATYSMTVLTARDDARFPPLRPPMPSHTTMRSPKEVSADPAES